MRAAEVGPVRPPCMLYTLDVYADRMNTPSEPAVQIRQDDLDGEAADVDGLEFVRTIAAARIMMPRSVVRLSAGREDMSDEMQALCFLAGANSIFYGEKLLTTGNPDTERDMALFARLGLRPMAVAVDADGHDRAGTVHADIAAPVGRPCAA
jgi:biotin synthase